MTLSEGFKNHILDCMEDVIYTTTTDLALAMIPKIQRRPHLESIRKALLILVEEGLVEKIAYARDHKNHYRLARTRPIVRSLRKAA